MLSKHDKISLLPAPVKLSPGNDGAALLPRNWRLQRDYVSRFVALVRQIGALPPWPGLPASSLIDHALR